MSVASYDSKQGVNQQHQNVIGVISGVAGAVHPPTGLAIDTAGRVTYMATYNGVDWLAEKFGYGRLNPDLPYWDYIFDPEHGRGGVALIDDYGDLDR